MRVIIEIDGQILKCIDIDEAIDILKDIRRNNDIINEINYNVSQYFKEKPKKDEQNDEPCRGYGCP